MPRTQIVLDIELDGRDGLIRVVADQRDIAAAEAADAYADMTRARFLGWSAAKRAGLYTGTWEKFNTHEAVEVVSGEITDRDAAAAAEAGDGLDPGQAGQSAGG